jgi:NADH:ubiquinone oxidoreductase subunit E
MKDNIEVRLVPYKEIKRICQKIKEDQKKMIEPLLKLEENKTMTPREASEKIQDKLMIIYEDIREMFV